MLTEYMSLQEGLENKYGEQSIVLYMKGTFYEMYSLNIPDKKVGNIEKICKILNIHLTQANKSEPHSIKNPYMSGFPTYALGKHLSRLLQHQYTVAVYDEDPTNIVNKIRIRKLIGIYSPSTYIDEEIIENNILACILIDHYFCPIQKYKVNVGYFSCIDLSTGKNKIAEFYDSKDNPNNVKNELQKLIYSINPCELIIVDDTKLLTFDDRLVHYLEKDSKFNDTIYQNTLLEKVFGKHKILSPVEYISLERNGELLYCYLQLLQFAYEHDPHIIKRIQKPMYLSSDNELIFNNDALSELNIVSNDTLKFSSLFNVVNKTKTKMGYRLLKERILRPIVNIDELNSRYDDVEKIGNNYQEYENILKYINDLEKKYRKMVLRRLNPYEFAKMDESFVNINRLVGICKDNFKIPESVINEFSDFYTEYKQCFDVNEMSKYDLTNIKTSFFNDDVDHDITLMQHKIDIIKLNFQCIVEWFDSIEFTNKARVKHVASDKEGNYFTTTNRKWENILLYAKHNPNEQLKLEMPGKYKVIQLKLSDLCIKDKNKSAVKFTSKLIDVLSGKLNILTNNIRILVKKKYLEKIQYFEKTYGKLFMYLVKKIAEIDVTVSSAHVSTIYSYKRPNIKEFHRSFVNIKGIRHPIIERIQDDTEYITNDFKLGKDQYGTLLYGLNSSGKSSLLRAIGANIILAQSGLFVSASNFSYYPFTKLLTKISSTDNLFKGQSTFVVEMCELKDILTKSDKNTMVLCDELTAGTETESATGIVASAISYLLEKNSNLIFTTHLHGIMKFPEIVENEKLNIFHFKILIEDQNLIYKRVLEHGSGDSKYGIEIANALGLDRQFIKNAFKFRKQFEDRTINILESKKSRYNSKKIVDQCERCGSKESLHTHHKNEQNTSDENGIITHFHKNIKHNLEILCEKCHIKHHNS